MSEEALATSDDTFGHMIDVELDRDELDAKKNRLVAVDKEIDAIAAEKAKAVGEYNADLKDKRAERTTLLGVISSGSSKVEIICYNERDDRRGMMLTRRKDTGEVVDERALTAEERDETPNDRQGNLFDKPAAPQDLDEDDDGEAPADADTEAALEAYAAERGKVAAAGDEPESDGDDESGDDSGSEDEDEEP